MRDECSQHMLESYLDGELDDRERARVEVHLGHCARCVGALRELTKQAVLLREHLETAADEVDFSGFDQAVFGEIEASSKASLWERLQEWWKGSVPPVLRWSPVAAAALLIVVIWTAPMLIGKDRTPVVSMKPTPATTASAPATAGNEVMIKSMKYSGQRSMIFTVSPKNTTVIWLVDFDKASSAKTKEDSL